MRAICRTRRSGGGRQREKAGSLARVFLATSKETFLRARAAHRGTAHPQHSSRRARPPFPSGDRGNGTSREKRMLHPSLCLLASLSLSAELIGSYTGLDRAVAAVGGVASTLQPYAAGTLSSVATAGTPLNMGLGLTVGALIGTALKGHVDRAISSHDIYGVGQIDISIIATPYSDIMGRVSPIFGESSPEVGLVADSVDEGIDFHHTPPPSLKEAVDPSIASFHLVPPHYALPASHCEAMRVVSAAPSPSAAALESSQSGATVAGRAVAVVYPLYFTTPASAESNVVPALAGGPVVVAGDLAGSVGGMVQPYTAEMVSAMIRSSFAAGMGLSARVALGRTSLHAHRAAATPTTDGFADPLVADMNNLGGNPFISGGGAPISATMEPNTASNTMELLEDVVVVVQPSSPGSALYVDEDTLMAAPHEQVPVGVDEPNPAPGFDSRAAPPEASSPLQVLAELLGEPEALRLWVPEVLFIACVLLVQFVSARCSSGTADNNAELLARVDKTEATNVALQGKLDKMESTPATNERFLEAINALTRSSNAHCDFWREAHASTIAGQVAILSMLNRIETFNCRVEPVLDRIDQSLPKVVGALPTENETSCG